KKQNKTRRIGIVAFPDSQILDIAGPLAVFTEAGRIFQNQTGAGSSVYQVDLISTAQERMISCYTGVSLTAHTDFRSFKGELDTLLVAGGYGVRHAGGIAGFLPWLCRTAHRARRLGSVCTGAVVLAEAGLLDGRRATTHWRWYQQIAERFPAIN